MSFFTRLFGRRKKQEPAAAPEQTPPVDTAKNAEPEQANEPAVPEIAETAETVKAEQTQETQETTTAETPSEPPVFTVKYKTSFMARLIQSDAALQDYYTALKNAILSYKKVKARTSWFCETFNCGRVLCAKLNVKGKALALYLNLDPADYAGQENKYHFQDFRVARNTRARPWPCASRVIEA